MGRNEFGLGVLVGGLAGVAIGYVVRRTSNEQSEELSAPDTIDLTSALRRRQSVGPEPGEPAVALE